jgi:hypothetical protein
MIVADDRRPLEWNNAFIARGKILHDVSGAVGAAQIQM